MANVILGATLAMEEDGIGAKDAVQSLKTSLMGPLRLSGDSVLDLDSDNHGIYRRIWHCKCNRRNFMDDHVRCIYWLKIWLCNLGYESVQS